MSKDNVEIRNFFLGGIFEGEEGTLRSSVERDRVHLDLYKHKKPKSADCTLKQLDMKIKKLISVYLSIYNCTGKNVLSTWSFKMMLAHTVIPQLSYRCLSRMFADI